MFNADNAIAIRMLIDRTLQDDDDVSNSHAAIMTTLHFEPYQCSAILLAHHGFVPLPSLLTNIFFTEH